MTLLPAMPVVRCAGVPITTVSTAAAAGAIVDIAQREHDSGAHIHLCNAFTLALADRDPEYRAILGSSTMNFADGTPVVWANRLLNRRRMVSPRPVRGPDLFRQVLAAGQPVGLRHYLLGSTPRVLESLTQELALRFPEARIVGVHSPPFRDLAPRERQVQATQIAQSGADVVWVGLGTPKQDVECSLMASELPKVFVAVGAAFDFVAGTKAEAPMWMRNSGVEWVHRLLTEPRRLWRRYLFGNLRFLRAVFCRRG